MTSPTAEGKDGGIVPAGVKALLSIATDRAVRAKAGQTAVPTVDPAVTTRLVDESREEDVLKEGVVLDAEIGPEQVEIAVTAGHRPRRCRK